MFFCDVDDVILVSLYFLGVLDKLRLHGGVGS
jgi:hypothetical protein